MPYSRLCDYRHQSSSPIVATQQVDSLTPFKMKFALALLLVATAYAIPQGSGMTSSGVDMSSGMTGSGVDMSSGMTGSGYEPAMQPSTRDERVGAAVNMKLDTVESY